MALRVTLIPGDGIGPEVAEAARLVLDAADVGIEWIERPAGTSALDDYGELIDGCVEPIGRLLQSVRLAHCAPPPQPRRRFFCQPPIKLLDARINVNVVTTDAMFNNHEPPRLVPARGRLTVPRAV